MPVTDSISMQAAESCFASVELMIFEMHTPDDTSLCATNENAATCYFSMELTTFHILTFDDATSW